MVLISLGLDVSGVALCFKPGAANFLVTAPLALFDQGLEACFHSVIKRYLLEADLASLPEGVVIALSLLHGFELCHKSFVAGCDVLVPTLLDLLLFQFLDMLDLDDTQGSIYVRANKAGNLGLIREGWPVFSLYQKTTQVYNLPGWGSALVKSGVSSTGCSPVVKTPVCSIT